MSIFGTDMGDDNDSDDDCLFCDDVIIYTDKNLSGSVFETFDRIRRQGRLCDVTLIADGQKYSAHKVVLAATIPFFYGMFMHDMLESSKNEINMSGLDGSALEELINFAYKGEIQITTNNVQSILMGASYLQLHNVQNACCDFIKERLTPASVISIRTFAQSFLCSRLVEATDNYLFQNFEKVVSDSDFVKLTPEDLLDVLGRDEIRVSSEERIFRAVMKWVKQDPDKRAAYIGELLKRVRLPLLSPRFLKEVVATEEIIRKSIQCRDLLDEAFYFLLMPEARASSSSFTCRPRRCNDVMGIIYAVGGLSPTGDSHSIVECYDPILRKWTVVENMATHRCRVGVAVLNGRLYAIGGYDGQQRLRTVEMFDPELNRWRTIASMNYPRSALGAAALDGKLYVCGGYDGSTSMRTCEVYIPEQDRWNMIPCMKDCRSAGGLVALGIKLYALGGHNGLAIYDSVECYDRSTGLWQMITPMLTRRCRHGVAVLNNRIYVAGGYNGVNFLQTVETYCPNTDQWSNVAPLAIPRSRVALTATCGSLFAIGGYDGSSNLRTVEQYDEYRDEWNTASPLTAHEGGVGVGVLPLENAIVQPSEDHLLESSNLSSERSQSSASF